MIATQPDVPTSPNLSIVVVVYNMQREAPRTLYTLSAGYQRDVEPQDYEVIVVDNGSPAPLSYQTVAQFGTNFRYHYIDQASPSPARAVNIGASLSKAANIGVMVDGARMVSPGAISLALLALGHFKRAIVSTIAFHLGPDLQSRSQARGYSRQVEDDLLATIDWQTNGYRLFEISALAGSSPEGWLGPIGESNLIFLSKALFEELGGFDERFTLPGGGFVNLDFYGRACAAKETTLLSLFGEATFHQFHGGIMTNRAEAAMAKELEAYNDDYRQIHGRTFESATRLPLLIGTYRPETASALSKACNGVLQKREKEAVIPNL